MRQSLRKENQCGVPSACVTVTGTLLFNHEDKSFEFIAMIPTFQLGKLMARKVEFLAQEDTVLGTRLRTQVYLNLEPQGPGCGDSP